MDDVYVLIFCICIFIIGMYVREKIDALIKRKSKA